MLLIFAPSNMENWNLGAQKCPRNGFGKKLFFEAFPTILVITMAFFDDTYWYSVPSPLFPHCGYRWHAVTSSHHTPKQEYRCLFILTNKELVSVLTLLKEQLREGGNVPGIGIVSVETACSMWWCLTAFPPLPHGLSGEKVAGCMMVRIAICQLCLFNAFFPCYCLHLLPAGSCLVDYSPRVLAPGKSWRWLTVAPFTQPVCRADGPPQGLAGWGSCHIDIFASSLSEKWRSAVMNKHHENEKSLCTFLHKSF